MSIRLLRSSGEAWSGISARLYDVQAGTIQSSPSTKHGIAMLVGSAIRTSCRCEGLMSKAMQRAGELHVIPAGHAAAWHDEGSTRFLDVDLDTTLVGASVSPALHVSDPQLEYVCRAVMAELYSGTTGRL